MEPTLVGHIVDRVMGAKSQPLHGRYKLAASIQPKTLPKVVREPEAIASALRKTLRSLVQGKAPWPLFLHGPTGVGKTCAALCVLDYAGGLYYTCPDLCASVIQSQHGRLDYSVPGGASGILWPEAFWNLLSKAKLVVLDEIGLRHNVSDHHYDCIKKVIDLRQGLPFIVISNLDLAAIGKLYDARISSRIGAGTVFQLSGKDRRR